MAWYPKATKRDIGRGRNRHTPTRFVLHTAVVSTHELRPQATGAFWHFYIGPTGTVFQYVDTIYRAGAETYPGSVGTISVETWDGYRRVGGVRQRIDQYGVQGWATESDVPAWTTQQAAALAELWAWLRTVHPTIPNRMATTSRADTTSHGLAWHRLGVAASQEQQRAGTSETGGVLWSSAAGKVCPGTRRIAQIPAIHATANNQPTANPQEDDMTPELAARLDQIVEFFNNRLNQNRDELAAWARDQIATPLSAEVAAGITHLREQLAAQLQELEDRAMEETLVPAIVATIDAIKGGTSAESIAEAVGSIVAEQTSTAVAQLAANLDAAVTQLVQALHDALDGRDNDAAVTALREVLENTSFTLAPRTEANQ